MMPKIYILLPVHNRKEITRDFIECLKAQTFDNYHLLLIDDGSTDGTAEMVKQNIPSTNVLQGTGDWWWAGSLQQGIDWLEHHETEDDDIVVFANDDITFGADFLQTAATILDGSNNVLLLPQVYDEKSGMVQQSGVEANLQKLTFKPAPSADRINCMPTRGLFMRMSDLRKIGGFHPKLLPHYWSDYEFTIRAHRKGLKLYTSPGFSIGFDREQTGFRGFEKTDFFNFIKQYFSKKSVPNPIYSSMFILLTNPLLYIPLNLAKTWCRSFVYIAKQLKRVLSQKIVKIRVLNAIRNTRSDLKIIVGSASTKQAGWISTNYPLLDLTDDRTFSALFATLPVRSFLAEHVWEHLSLQEGATACRNCLNFLRKGGTLRIAVPDGFHPDADYIAQVKPGGYGSGSDDHKVLYNYQTLSAELKNAGYQVKLLEWFDEHGNFHYEEWNPKDGMIRRSTRFDPRNKTNPTAYTSLIIDAIKP